MPTIEQSMMIDRPVDQVWRFMTDFEKAARGVGAPGTEVRKTSEGPTGVGSTFRLTTRFLGRPREFDLRISEWEPNRKVVLAGELGPVKQSQTFLFESIEGKTRFTRVAEAEVHGLWKLLQPIMVWRANREIRRAMANLKRLLESQAEA